MDGIIKQIKEAQFFNVMTEETKNELYKIIQEDREMDFFRNAARRDKYEDETSINEFLEIKQQNERDRLYFEIEELLYDYIEDELIFEIVKRKIEDIIGEVSPCFTEL